ncbi:hypothetical protein AAHE18_15G159200 [Arachis hypogaea]
MVHMILNFREMTYSTKTHVDGIHVHGVPTSKILGYMVRQACEYSLMGFSKTDTNNYIDKTKRAKIVDGVYIATIVYSERKVGADAMCIARYNLIDDNILANMFWANGHSKI